MTKFPKIGAVVSGLVILGLITFLFMQRQAQQKLRDESQALREQLDRLKIENQRLSALASSPNSQDLSVEQFKELVRLRGEVAKLRQKQKDLPKNPAASATQASPVASPPQPRPEDVVPRESWQFVGYATPESAFQSSIWAMSSGDVQTVMNSFTSEGQAALTKQFEGKSETEIAALLSEEISKLKVLRLDRKKVSADGDVSFTLLSEERDDGSARTRDEAILQFRNVGGEWKCTGF